MALRYCVTMGYAAWKNYLSLGLLTVGGSEMNCGSVTSVKVNVLSPLFVLGISCSVLPERLYGLRDLVTGRRRLAYRLQTRLNARLFS